MAIVDYRMVLAFFRQEGKDPAVHADGSFEDPEKRARRIALEINTGRRSVSDVLAAIRRLPDPPPAGAAPVPAPGLIDWLMVLAFFREAGKDPSLHADGSFEDPDKRAQRIAREINTGQRSVSEVLAAIRSLPDPVPATIGATVAAIKHAAKVRAMWVGRITGRPVTVVRKVAGTTFWSQHSYGNAIDFGGSSVDLAALALWAARTALSWSVATVIYNRRIWSSSTQQWSTYRGVNPHTTHIHIDYLPRWAGDPPGWPLGTAPGGQRVYPAIPSGAAGLDVLVTSSWSWKLLARVTLRRGSRGGAVTALQILLRRYGFLSTSGIDGIFGPVTEAAVTRMQSMASIASTGQILSADWRALFWGPTAWAAPVDVDVGGGDWRRAPQSPPIGELEHSWESTLRSLTPLVGGAATSVSWYARAIKDATR
ncbi:hypothetical protein LCGC14_1139380 [marine sediment metagenome]|uniref:Uncharacterized protein n=1 Tax=marine sediment metagenome TaxID=412755 RepID=A0A0F9MLQ7_9ZZZZ